MSGRIVSDVLWSLEKGRAGLEFDVCPPTFIDRDSQTPDVRGVLAYLDRAIHLLI